MSITVALGSLNVNKVEATKSAFGRQWPEEEIEVITHTSASGVPGQPINMYQIKLGARSRCYNAGNEYPGSSFAVGIEGGIYRDGPRIFETTVFHVLEQKAGREVYGYGPSVPVADGLARLVDSGLDLSTAIQRITGIMEIGKQEGFYGLLTRGTANRVDTYALCLTLILGGFTHPELD